MVAKLIKFKALSIQQIHQQTQTVEELIRCSIFLHNVQRQYNQSFSLESPFSQWIAWLNQNATSSLNLDDTLKLIQLLDVLINIGDDKQPVLTQHINIEDPILPKLMFKIEQEILQQTPYSFLLREKIESILRSVD